VHSAGGKAPEDASHFPAFYYGSFHHCSPLPEHRSLLKTHGISERRPALLLLHLYRIWCRANSHTFCLLPLFSSLLRLLIYLLPLVLFNFLYPAFLWRGALSLLSSGHFKEAEQTQCPQQTAAPKRPKGKHRHTHTHVHTEKRTLCVESLHLPRAAVPKLKNATAQFEI